jgi:hypothetical protein
VDDPAHTARLEARCADVDALRPAIDEDSNALKVWQKPAKALDV